MSYNKEKIENAEDIESVEELEDIIVLNDENGNEVEFVYLDTIEYKGDEYVVLLPVDDEDGEVVILQLVPGDENAEEDELVSVYDDSIVDKVYELFREKYKDEFKFE